jgi:type I protein arginine methyltransferase
LDFDDSWSDDEPEATESSVTEPSDLPSALRRIHTLERKLALATQELTEVRLFVTQRLDSDLFTNSSPPAPRERDDDSHYFESYGESEIHQIMLQDRVRTSTYADFILRTPQIFVDAVVLDVGCGTGILSLFAARAGAKKVFAVDAAPIAEKARETVKRNGMEDVITFVSFLLFLSAHFISDVVPQCHPRQD